MASVYLLFRHSPVDAERPWFVRLLVRLGLRSAEPESHARLLGVYSSASAAQAELALRLDGDALELDVEEWALLEQPAGLSRHGMVLPMPGRTISERIS